MSVPVRTLLASKAAMDANARKAMEKLIEMNVIAIPGIIVPALIGLIKHEQLSPDAMIGLSILVVASTVLFTKQLFEISHLAVNNNREAALIPKNGVANAVLSPLAEELPLETKVALEDMERNRLLLETTGNDAPPNTEVTDKSGDDQLITRLASIQFVESELLDQKIKSTSPQGPEQRSEILMSLSPILAGFPSALGLSLTEFELEKLLKVVEVGSVTERAPETMAAYVKLLYNLLESYILNSRVDSRSRSVTELLMGKAAQMQAITGRLVSPPIIEFIHAQSTARAEEKKVVIKHQDIIKLAKSFTALCHSTIPEVREVAERFSVQISELIKSERTRVSGKPEEIPIIEMQQILGISLKRAIGEADFKILSDLIHGYTFKSPMIYFGSPFEDLQSATSILRAFSKTNFGSISFSDRMLTIDADNIALADILACTVACLYPHVESISIKTPGDGVLHLSMDAFYLNRLIRNDRGYLRRMFNPSDLLTNTYPEPTGILQIQA